MTDRYLIKYTKVYSSNDGRRPTTHYWSAPGCGMTDFIHEAHRYTKRRAKILIEKCDPDEQKMLKLVKI